MLRRSLIRFGALMVFVPLLCFSAKPADTTATARHNNQTPGFPAQFVHDPSTIAKCDADYWVFSTGPGIASHHSRNLTNWESGPRVFSSPPIWTTNAVPGFRGYFWAPDIIHVGNRYLLYYSVSRWGVNTSAIGLATNPTLDQADPSFAWTDQGPVCQSHREDNFNAIDPSVMRASDGSLWLAFGSFWTGIKLIQLDPNTGKRISSGSPIYSPAFHDSIEAACLVERQGAFYLFVNWGQCCKGTNSTYNIRIGRSAGITGPYLDKNGKDLLQGGGTLFLESKGRFIGPGHAGVYAEAGVSWFSYHYYDGERGGAATLAVQRLDWGTDGWPALVEEERK